MGKFVVSLSLYQRLVRNCPFPGAYQYGQSAYGTGALQVFQGIAHHRHAGSIYFDVNNRNGFGVLDWPFFQGYTDLRSYIIDQSVDLSGQRQLFFPTSDN